ncbi:uncharacterized protein EV154DRAFT_603575 [Mucor mucedo]|uniref:uncharacterized protein n=1 Tax=Mucor mucedo TaxID=29922 RepID=UPI00221EF341|nr:uncharacterized protein EV154DRAFT_603575 [Mucor mucedo]KAI7890033.1 hypothetical protein EV154DRAFT_603575 [Mucor mucedo]
MYRCRLFLNYKELFQFFSFLIFPLSFAINTTNNMKFQMITIAFSLFVATSVSAAAIPGIHQVCDQNLACSKDLYCRISGNPVYGTCEDPKHV